MYLRQAWRDARLVFEPGDSRTKELRLGDDSWTEIWIPDTFFRNEKRSAFHEVTVKNRLLRLNATGHLWYVVKWVSAPTSHPVTLHYTTHLWCKICAARQKTSLSSHHAVKLALQSRCAFRRSVVTRRDMSEHDSSISVLLPVIPGLLVPTHPVHGAASSVLICVVMLLRRMRLMLGWVCMQTLTN